MIKNFAINLNKCLSGERKKEKGGESIMKKRLYMGIVGILCFVFILSGCGSKEKKNILGVNGNSERSIIKNISLVLSSSFTKSPTGKYGSLSYRVPFVDDDQYPDAFITPSEYSVALKRVSLIKSDNTKVDLINKSNLTSSIKLDFINDNAEQKLGINGISAGQYKGLYFEIYYLQMKFPINNVERNIRIYLSDDEVSGEGQHHQGDITIIDNNGQEIGWFVGPADFSGTKPRPYNLNYSGIDPQTGHDRGPFGDQQFWNVDQPEDIFNYTVLVDINVTTINKIKISFNVKDTWFYDDVDQNGIFSPGPNPGDDANAVGKHWSPIFPGIDIVIE